VLIENPSFIEGYTGFQNLKVLSMIRNRVGDQELRESLIRVGLDPDDRRTYKKYSLGMKQRLGIACAIMEHPNLILLDEPVNALDENGIKLVRQILQEEKERGALIIVACHDREELELLSDKIYTMAEGSITGETDEKKMEQN
jgi:ABC-2 type transport system ATP-binding protein